MQILIEKIVVEIIETTPVNSLLKTYEQGDKSTIHFTVLDGKGMSIQGQVESINPAFDAAMDGLRGAIELAIKDTFK